MRKFLRLLLGIVLSPVLALTAPIYALAARTGIGAAWCRRFGWQPVRVHFYQPIPEYEKIPPAYFEVPRSMPGVRFDEGSLPATLESLGVYATECRWPEGDTPEGVYSATNGAFGFTSAALLHGMIRSGRIRRVIEIGCGFSTLITLDALRLNADDGMQGVALTCIEPFPAQWLRKALSKAAIPVELITSGAETVGMAHFESLGEGDLLFIDSSHVAKLGSDVNFLFHEVLPRLRAGVLVHVHDIYLPYEYPAIHFFGENKIYWNEQYILQAFLACNNRTQILAPGFFVLRHHAEAFRAAFPQYDPVRHRPTSSFWFKFVE